MTKKKILFISDHPLVLSGVGTQAKYLIEGLLKTGKYRFLCWGGAIRHPNYNVQRVDRFGEDWTIIPVDGHGDKDRMRETLRRERPDAVVLFTDPRFFTWAWEMEDEIRSVCPILYWHVWDNDPTPTYNKVLYDSTDYIVTLSLKTAGLLSDLGYKDTCYIPHAVSPDIFRQIPEHESLAFRRQYFGPHADKEFLVFWNNRNARRKMTGDVVATFAKFLQKVGKDKAALVMHTAVGDPEGQNVIEVAKCYGVESNLVVSENRVPAEVVNLYYNACDVTVNIANNEGFGLGTLESIMAGTPIIVNMTGGLQFQVGDWWEDLKDFSDQEKLFEVAKRARQNKIHKGDNCAGRWWGVPIFPASRSCTGSQQIPFIYDDRVNHDDVVEGLMKMYRLGKEGRRKLGTQASLWARETFNLDRMVSEWDRVIQEQLLRFAAVSRNKVRTAVL